MSSPARKTRNYPLSAAIDDLGKVQAEIKTLEETAKPIIARIKEEAPGEYKGDKFKAAVTSSERSNIPKEVLINKLRELMSMEDVEAFLAKYTETTDVISLRVTAIKLDA